MSTDIGAVAGRADDRPWLQGSGLRGEIHVTRFYGGSSGPCMQLTIGDQFVQLDAEGRAALVEKLLLGASSSPSPVSPSGESRTPCADGPCTLTAPGCAGPSLQETER